MDTADALVRIPMLRDLPEAAVRVVAEKSRVRTLARGEAHWELDAPAASFSFVVRGSLKLVKPAADGRETIIELCGPGDLLCTGAVCHYRPYCCAAVSLEDDTEVVTVPRLVLLGLFEESTGMGQALLHASGTRNIALCRRVGEMAGGLVEQRISALLLRLAEGVGVPRNGRGTWLPVALSRQDLADLTGTTVETAIRVMTRFARDGIVKTAARGFVVQDRAALEAVARGGGR